MRLRSTLQMMMMMMMSDDDDYFSVDILR